MIDPQPDGDLLVDSRNTWAAYEVNKHKRPDPLASRRKAFPALRWVPARPPPGSTTPWSSLTGTITFFDNGATPKVHPQSRGNRPERQLDTENRDPPRKLRASEPSACGCEPGRPPGAGRRQLVRGLGSGAILLRIRTRRATPVRCSSPQRLSVIHRVQVPLVRRPTQPPAIGVRSGIRGGLVVYASWNGATAVSQWRLLAGSSSRALVPVASEVRSGFETTIALAHASRYLAVQALNVGGGVLGTSRTVRP